LLLRAPPPKRGKGIIDILSEQSQQRLADDATSRIVLRSSQIAFVLDQLLELTILKIHRRLARFAVWMILDVLLKPCWMEGFD